VDSHLVLDCREYKKLTQSCVDPQNNSTFIVLGTNSNGVHTRGTLNILSVKNGNPFTHCYVPLVISRKKPFLFLAPTLFKLLISNSASETMG